MTATNPYIPQPDDQHTSTQYGSPEQPQQAQQTYGQYQGQPYTDGGQTPPEQPAYGAPYTQQPYNAQYGASYNAPYTAPYTPRIRPRTPRATTTDSPHRPINGTACASPDSYAHSSSRRSA